MSVLIVGVAAAVAATVQEAVAWRMRLHRIARAMPRRARQYKFN